MNLDETARLVGKVSLLVKLGARSLLGINSNSVPKEWVHITKVDPEPEKQLPLLYPLYLQHTSAISVGGSRDVNSANTEQTFDLLEPVATPIFHEPSAVRHVTEKTREKAEFLAIPEVLNGDSSSLVGTLGEGIEYLRDEMLSAQLDEELGWLPRSIKNRLADLIATWLLEQAVFEAYIIQNQESAAAREANVTEEDLLAPPEAAQRALAAEKHLESSVIYLEYSGTYGGAEATEILSAIDENISWPRIWYGGGVSSRQQAVAVLEAGADTVVVGDVFHEIADEESEIVDQACTTLASGASLSEVENWIDSKIDIPETSSFQYLSTIPTIDNPEEITAKYLARTIQIHILKSTFINQKDAELLEKSAFENYMQVHWTSNEGNQVPQASLDMLWTYISDQTSGESHSVQSRFTHIASLRKDFK